MEVPLEITYRNVEKSNAIEALIHKKAAKLDEMHDRIISCRVSLEKPQEHKRPGDQYRIRIDLRVPPGKELVVRREATGGDTHDPLRVLITEAFKKIQQQLKKLKGKQRGEVKSHFDGPEETAFVVRVFPEDGYGFVKTVSGREVYFHENSVANDAFDRIEVGTGVRIVQADGEKGPQASTVHIVDKPGAVTSKKRTADLEMPLDWKP